MLDLFIAAMLAQGTPARADPCLAADAPTPAPRGCPVWQPLYRGDNGVVLSEPAPLRRSANGFDLRVRLIWPADQEGGLRSGIAIYRFDCAAETAVLQHNIGYDARGRRLLGGPLTDAPTIASPPGSPNRAALDRFCPRR